MVSGTTLLLFLSFWYPFSFPCFLVPFFPLRFFLQLTVIDISSGNLLFLFFMRGAQVDKRLSNMKLHGSVVPQKKDIDELRNASKKEVYVRARERV